MAFYMASSGARAITHPSHDDIRRSALRVDEDVLDRLDAQLRALQLTRDQITLAIAQSHAALEAVDQEMVDIVQRRDSLNGTVRRKRAALVPRHFMEIPLELLGDIFEHLCGLNSFEDWIETPLGKRKLNRERIASAYNVAAVCRHWRAAAFAAPAIWSYIGVHCYAPNNNAKSAATTSAKWAKLVQGVRTLLERSKAAPLDIHLDWSDADDVMTNAHYQTVLDALGAHTTRWRSFELRCIRVGVPLQWLDVFRAPTPLLEELSILSQPDADMTWKSPYPRYLPVAPRLQALYLEHCPLISTTGLPALTMLDIWLTTLPAPRAWDILCKCPQLVSLLLSCRPVELESAPPGEIHLDALQTLEMHNAVEPLFVAHGRHLSMPKVNELCLFGHMVVPLRQFLPGTCANVTSLVVFTGTLDVPAADSLIALSRLQTVKFIECELEDAFIATLFRPTDPTWPDLRRIELEKVEMRPPDGDGLVRLLRARNCPDQDQDQPSTDSAPRRKLQPIQEVIFDEGSLPKWIAAEIRYILDVTVKGRE
ncbi:hypothetical protein EXIGLDRAFT_695133 [Exidia glandulosa HHB12029]|uniref:Uncharacterized protein n=1 Tax=Exidia glandulosa HHB12029 TaxID=1314781 RepID=A0A165G3T1_EXIGL|nr:hypothetical protein EXIGLDRAFT_695133 [Exidia glandulosa HHB12029]